MAPAHVSIWTQCLKDLQRLPAVIDDQGEQHAQFGKTLSYLDQLWALPAPSASVWRQLVLDVKVRHTVPNVDVLMLTHGWHGSCATVTPLIRSFEILVVVLPGSSPDALVVPARA